MSGIRKFVKVGHLTDRKNLTGATLFLFPERAIARVVRRGGGHTSRQLDALFTSHVSVGIEGLLVTGGSALGLSSADGVVKFLREKGVGLETRGGAVPRVPTVAIFDLGVGNPKPPSSKALYQLCKRIWEKESFEVVSGRHGVGTGATCGKVFGIEKASWGGVGMVADDETLCFVVVNAFGDVFFEGKKLAGSVDGDTLEAFESGFFQKLWRKNSFPNFFSSTVITVFITTFALETQMLDFLAELSSSAVANMIRPAHTPFDGDFSFAVSVGQKKPSPSDIPKLFAKVFKMTQECILKAVKNSKPVLR